MIINQNKITKDLEKYSNENSIVCGVLNMKCKMVVRIGSEIEFIIFRKERWCIILDVYPKYNNIYTRIGMTRIVKSNKAEEILNRLPL